MSGRLAVIPTLPCQYLNGNDCMIYGKHPMFCKDYPGKYEDCNQEWLDAMGCKFFEEESHDSINEHGLNWKTPGAHTNKEVM